MTFSVVVSCFSSSLRITIMAKMRPISNNFCNFFAGWVLAARIAICKRAPRLGANLVNATGYELRTVRFTLQRNALRLRLSITIRTNSVYCWISVTSLLSNR